MMIRVMYNNGSFDMVKPALLDNLLGSQKVTSFKRSTGWVVVGRDPIRAASRSARYHGPERRAA